MTNNVKNGFKQPNSSDENDLIINGTIHYGEDAIIIADGKTSLGEVDYTSRVRVFIEAAISGGNSSSYVIKSENYTITTDDYDVEFDTSGVTATLPDASGHNDEYRIDNSSGGTITLASNSGTIQDEVTQTIPSNASVTVRSNGINWRLK